MRRVSSVFSRFYTSFFPRKVVRVLLLWYAKSGVLSIIRLPHLAAARITRKRKTLQLVKNYESHIIERRNNWSQENNSFWCGILHICKKNTEFTQKTKKLHKIAIILKKIEKIIRKNTMVYQSGLPRQIKNWSSFSQDW